MHLKEGRVIEYGQDLLGVNVGDLHIPTMSPLSIDPMRIRKAAQHAPEGTWMNINVQRCIFIVYLNRPPFICLDGNMDGEGEMEKGIGVLVCGAIGPRLWIASESKSGQVFALPAAHLRERFAVCVWTGRVLEK